MRSHGHSEALPLGVRLQNTLNTIDLGSVTPELRNKVADLQITHGSPADRDAVLDRLQNDLLVYGQNYKEEVEKYIGDDTVISIPVGNPQFVSLHTYLEGWLDMAQQHAPELAAQFIQEVMDILVVNYDADAFKLAVWQLGDDSISYESKVSTLASQIAHDVARYADSVKLIEQCLDHPFITEYANGGALVALESAWAALMSRDDPEEKGAYYEVVGDAVTAAIAKGVGLTDLRQGIESIAANAPDVLDQLATDNPDRATLIYRLAGKHTIKRYVQPSID